MENSYKIRNARLVLTYRLHIAVDDILVVQIFQAFRDTTDLDVALLVIALLR
jgi:hypothetical protein